MIILGIETSSDICGAGIAKDEALLGKASQELVEIANTMSTLNKYLRNT